MKCSSLFFLVFACSALLQAETFLVFGGKTGWIGQKMVKEIQKSGHEAVCAVSRLENREEILAEIQRVKPDAIVNCAGITGKPNVDWCETHQIETLRVNVLGALNLIDAAYLCNIHVTNVTTGCIYLYDEAHPEGSGIGFTEEEEPNFTGSYYSKTKVLLETLLRPYPHVLNLRIKMPLSTELTHGFVAKIITYKKVVNIANSLCVLDDLLPIAVDMTLRRIKGVFHFVNPGVMTHNEVLQLYKEYVDPHLSWENFSLTEQAQILKAPRSNAQLSVAKLLKYYPNIPSIRDSLTRLFIEMKKQKENP